MIKSVTVINSKGEFLDLECDEYEFDLSHIKLRKDGKLVALFNNYQEFYVTRRNDES